MATLYINLGHVCVNLPIPLCSNTTSPLVTSIVFSLLSSTQNRKSTVLFDNLHVCFISLCCQRGQQRPYSWMHQQSSQTTRSQYQFTLQFLVHQDQYLHSDLKLQKNKQTNTTISSSFTHSFSSKRHRYRTPKTSSYVSYPPSGSGGSREFI